MALAVCPPPAYPTHRILARAGYPTIGDDPVVVREPSVRIVTSETDAPLNRVFLARRHAKVDRQVGLAGEFMTRDGRFGLDFPRIPLAMQEQTYGALEYTAWAPRRAVARFSAYDVLVAGELVIALAPGELARLRASSPVSRAELGVTRR